MRPTPRKLALLMSIAGLGASLGDAAQAKIDGGHDGFTAVSGVPGLAHRGNSEAMVAQERNFPFAPSALFDNISLDTTLRVADEATLAAARRFFRHEANERPTASVAAIEPSQDDHGAVAAMAVAPLALSLADAFSYTVASPVARASFGTVPISVDTSGQWVVNGLRVHQPKGSPIAAEASDSDRAPEQDVEVASWLGHGSDTAAEPTAIPSRQAGDTVTAAFAADKGFKVSEQKPDPYLALHHQTLAFQEIPVSGGPSSNSGSTLALATGDDPALKKSAWSDLKPSRDQDASADFHTAPNTASDPQTNIASNPDLDRVASLDLNLEFDATLDLNLDLAAGLDLDLDTLSNPCMSGSCTGGHASASTDRVSKIVVGGSHADRIMRDLEALSSKEGYTLDRFGTQADEIFVATHSEKVMLMLALTLRQAASKDGFVEAETQIDTPSVSALHEPASPINRAARPVMDQVMALSESNLDQVRGGFETNTGLQMSFGIERAVYVNGALVTTPSINIVGTGNSVAAQVPGTTGSAGNLTLIQNGSGNTFTTGSAAQASLGTIIQNTLDNQKIQGVTTINATVNSLQIMKSQNFESSLRGAIVDSLRR